MVFVSAIRIRIGFLPIYLLVLFDRICARTIRRGELEIMSTTLRLNVFRNVGGGTVVVSLGLEIYFNMVFIATMWYNDDAKMTRGEDGIVRRAGGQNCFRLRFMRTAPVI